MVWHSRRCAARWYIVSWLSFLLYWRLSSYSEKIVMLETRFFLRFCTGMIYRYCCLPKKCYRLYWQQLRDIYLKPLKRKKNSGFGTGIANLCPLYSEGNRLDWVTTCKCLRVTPYFRFNCDIDDAWWTFINASMRLFELKVAPDAIQTQTKGGGLGPQ